MHNPPDSIGDCWRTTIACICDISSPTEVPHFVELDYDNPYSTRWWYDSVAFVEDHMPGMTLVSMSPGFPVPTPLDVVIAAGVSMRDVPHVVIADAKTGDMVWDPYPNGTGLRPGSVDEVIAVVKRSYVYD